MEDRHLAPERRKVRHGLAPRTVRRHQLRDGPPPLRDHDLASLTNLVEKRREVLASLADSSGAHDRIVLHVAHGVNGGGIHRRSRSRRALKATITVDADMRTAPMAGVSRMPTG